MPYNVSENNGKVLVNKCKFHSWMTNRNDLCVVLVQSIGRHGHDELNHESVWTQGYDKWRGRAGVGGRDYSRFCQAKSTSGDRLRGTKPNQSTRHTWIRIANLNIDGMRASPCRWIKITLVHVALLAQPQLSCFYFRGFPLMKCLKSNLDYCALQAHKYLFQIHKYIFEIIFWIYIKSLRLNEWLVYLLIEFNYKLFVETVIALIIANILIKLFSYFLHLNSIYLHII